MKYLIITLLLSLLEILYFQVAKRFQIVDRPNQRSSHKGIVIRGGGIIFLIAAWLWSLFFNWDYLWFLTGLTMIGVICFADDIKPVANAPRLVIQFIAMFLMFYQVGLLSPERWWMVIVAVVVCVGILNAFNFMDGINGVTGGYSLAVLLPLLYLDSFPGAAALSDSFVHPSLLWVMVLACLVFCFFNFRLHARCFAGDVGAICIAFTLVFCLGRLILRTRDVTYLMLMAVYGVDTVMTILHRIHLHEPLGVAHRKHAYQLMANELKIPHIVVSSFYMGLQLMISAGLVFLPVNHWLYSLVVLVLLVSGYVVFMKKYYYLHEEYLASLAGH